MANLELLYQLLVVLALLGADIRQGVAPYYSPGLMARVSANRGLPIVDCMVSSPRYPIGTWLVVVGLNTERAERCRVTDVSDPTVKCKAGRCESDQARHLRTGREVELGYAEAGRLCGRAALKERPEACPVIVIYQEEQPHGYSELDRLTHRMYPVSHRVAARRRALG